MKRIFLICFMFCCVLLYPGSASALLVEGSWNSVDNPGLISTGAWSSVISGVHPGWVDSTLDAWSDVSGQWSISNLVRTGGTIVDDGTTGYGTYSSAYYQEIVHTNDSGTAAFHFNGDDYVLTDVQGESTSTFYFISEAAYLVYGISALIGIEDISFTQSAFIMENGTLFLIEFTITGYRTWTDYLSSIPTHGGVVDYVELSISAVPAPVPEPGTMILLGTGLIAIAGSRRLRRRG